MNMELSTSKYVILESGSVIVPENDYVQFKFGNLRFRFVFAPNDLEQSDENATVEGTVKKDEEGEYLEINIVNYNGLFDSPMEKINVGSIGGKPLFVYFSIAPLISDKTKIKNRIVLYTWYKEK